MERDRDAFLLREDGTRRRSLRQAPFVGRFLNGKGRSYKIYMRMCVYKAKDKEKEEEEEEEGVEET